MVGCIAGIKFPFRAQDSGSFARTGRPWRFRSPLSLTAKLVYTTLCHDRDAEGSTHVHARLARLKPRVGTLLAEGIRMTTSKFTGTPILS